MGKLAVIDVCGANFLSVEIALKRLQVDYIFTHDKNVINKANGILLPGVGAASFAMQNLELYGLVSVIQNYKKPLLGICLGMQLLYESSAEGNVPCLGVIEGTINKFESSNGLVVPHMGWHNMELKVKNEQIIHGVTENDDVYFVHSYYAPISNATVASVSYGVEFTAICKYNNFYGMQFHPEKSGSIGEKLLANFLNVIK